VIEKPLAQAEPLPLAAACKKTTIHSQKLSELPILSRCRRSCQSLGLEETCSAILELHPEKQELNSNNQKKNSQRLLESQSKTSTHCLIQISTLSKWSEQQNHLTRSESESWEPSSVEDKNCWKECGIHTWTWTINANMPRLQTRTSDIFWFTLVIELATKFIWFEL